MNCVVYKVNRLQYKLIQDVTYMSQYLEYPLCKKIRKNQVVLPKLVDVRYHRNLPHSKVQL